MKFTTQTIYTNVFRFFLVAISALTIASCSKENDEVTPEPVASIEITNLEDGDFINGAATFELQTAVSSLTGTIIEPKVSFTNDEGETTEFELIGKMPEIEGHVNVTLSAQVSGLEEGEYSVIASFQETGVTNSIVISEQINITVQNKDPRN
ncbi:hypothetical protein [Flammeovirga sp. SJP92]|uniref:hypothetical protein n=1 Tax=Flammeovirga sp. SJP92 TaxID=1775430 RepID=UPI0007882CE5|nr:hypothetical protein [Flammeovirga sp. SJP92]KXX70366.1 hypothetical protein AVL50_12230 [Flammeovirga sp. SJP92]